MEITVDFRHGPLDVEFQAEDREELEENLEQFIDFLDDNEGVFKGLSAPKTETNSNETGTQTDATAWDDDTQPKVEESRGEYTEAETHLAERVRSDPSELTAVVEVPEDEDDRPHIKTWQFEDGEEILGGSRKDRQARASLILLYMWRETAGVDGVTLETLKRALSDSDIDPSRIDTMYTALDGDAEKYINKPGGRGGEISLNPDGEHQGRQELRSLVEQAGQ